MNRIIALLLLCSQVLLAQEHAWVYLKDKPNSQRFLDNPLSMLSQRAIDRKAKLNISIDLKDVPVDAGYITLVNATDGVDVLAVSKWMNAIHVFGLKENLAELSNLSFVEQIDYAVRDEDAIVARSGKTSKIHQVALANTIAKTEEVENFVYGETSNQNTMIGADALHAKGFNGEGMLISVIDDSFYGVKSSLSFRHLFDEDTTNGEVLGGINYVTPSKDVYFAIEDGSEEINYHGVQVLSVMAALEDESFVGTAPRANYFLFVTEDQSKETPLEESLWLQAAEKSDSLGVDIINTSLGYNEFDDARYNYTYQEMDGETTYITRGATIAVEKGMLVVTSVGNSGNNSWKYLSAPADAKNILSVGAVDANGGIANFSSFGPSADGRIKPETLAQGGNVAVLNEFNENIKVSGTSFSSPLVAGVAACLWQFYPEKTHLEIRELIIQNSSNYNNPGQQEGFGVLNAGRIVNATKGLTEENELPFEIVFHPEEGLVEILLNRTIEDVLSIEIYSTTGVRLLKRNNIKFQYSIDYTHFSTGIYFFRYSYQGNTGVLPFYRTR